MKITESKRQWIPAKNLKRFLENELRKIKRKGEAPLLLGKRVVDKNGKITFIPTEVTSSERYRERAKKKPKVKRKKKA
jgi:hypothetical protein